MANFYKCASCEGVMLAMSAPGTLSINSGMELMAPNTSDGAQEKHVPVVSMEGDEIVIKIGSVPHPMLEEHYIEWVYVKTSFGGVKCELNPGDPPEVRLKLQPDEVEEVYAYCNLHGLWKAPTPVLPLTFDVNTVACSPEFSAGCIDPSDS